MITLSLTSYSFLCLFAGFTAGVIATIITRMIVRAVDPELLRR